MTDWNKIYLKKRTMSTKPRKYQTKGAHILAHKMGGRGLLADEMGLGKSLTSLLTAKELGAKRVIVVCPAIVKYKWQIEASKHLGMRSDVIEGQKVPTRRRLLDRQPLIIINQDILIYWYEYLIDLEPDMLILDEIHNFKNHRAKRTQAAKEISNHCKYVIELSGTPLDNGKPIELWAPLNIIRPDRFASYMKFGHKYSRPKNDFGELKFEGTRNLDKLHKRLKKYMVRRTVEEVLDELPKNTKSITPVSITNLKEYRHAERDLIGWLRTVTNDKGKIFRAQKAQRFVKFGYLLRLVAQGKMKAIKESLDSFMEESEEKIIVFGVNRSILGELHEHYRKSSVLINGSVTGRKRQAAIDIFSNKKRYRFCFGNIIAAGQGWDGVAARHTQFIQLPWKPGEVDQCIARVRRMGQTRKCFSNFLIAKGTIEERLCSLLQTKKKIINRVVDGDGQGEDLEIMDMLTESLLGKG